MVRTIIEIVSIIVTKNVIIFDIIIGIIIFN